MICFGELDHDVLGEKAFQPFCLRRFLINGEGDLLCNVFILMIVGNFQKITAQ